MSAEGAARYGQARRALGLGAVSGETVRPLDRGFEVLRLPRGAITDPRELRGIEAPWRKGIVPGTVAMTDGGRADGLALDEWDHWYRCRFDRPGERGRVLLCFDGLATLADVFLNGAPILVSESMFLAHAVDVTDALADHNELAIRFRALAPVLRARRPRGRWPTRLVSERNLRFVRTTLLGYMPGFCPPVRPVGPYRPVRLVVQRDLGVEAARIVPSLEGERSVLEVELVLRSFRGDACAARLGVGGGAARAELELTRDDERGTTILRGRAVADGIAPWWPHTHGHPSLHEAYVDLELEEGAARIELGAVGFRSVEALGPADGGFGLRLNGREVFCRGACWAPLDVVALQAPEAETRRALELARDAGMNMIRVGGTMVYESDAFHRACDELGILVFQDFMFANMDYPAEDPTFMSSVALEAEQLLERIGHRPSLAVLCGGSEVEQQAAMMGLPREAWASELFDRLLPERCAAGAPRVPYVRSTPSGGAMPFYTAEGLCHYYGVGAYLRPPEDVRQHRVRFASECLALSNVPEEPSLRAWLADEAALAHHPRYKERVPRDPGASWDFADVTDHYVETLFDVDARAVRYADHERYLALSRAASVTLMERTQGHFRAAGSGCHGALVWTMRDLWDGAGFGVIDARGRPKAPYFALRRAWAPVAAWLVDDGLDGVVLHVANDRPEPFVGHAEISLLAVDGSRVDGVAVRVDVPARAQSAIGVEAALGHFVDSSHAYRFGPPQHAMLRATLARAGEADPFAQAVHLPLGLAHAVEPDLGLEASARPLGGGAYEVTVRTERLALFVAAEATDHVPSDAYFHLAPRTSWRFTLRPIGAPAPLRARIRALNTKASRAIRERDAASASGTVR